MNDLALHQQIFCCCCPTVVVVIVIAVAAVAITEPLRWRKLKRTVNVVVD
jgi:hypothetical protein